MHDFIGERRQAHIDVVTDVQIPVGIEKSNQVRILSIFHPLSSRIVVPARLCSQTKKILERNKLKHMLFSTVKERFHCAG